MDITCFGFLVLFQCRLPAPQPTGTARFCQVVRAAGGPLKPSRRDTPETAAHLARLDRAYLAVCRGPA